MAYIKYRPGDVLVTPDTFKVLNARYISGENLDTLARTVQMSDKTLRREWASQNLPQRKHGPAPRTTTK